MLITLVVVVRNVSSAITDRGTVGLQRRGTGSARIRLPEKPKVLIRRFSQKSIKITVVSGYSYFNW